MPVNRQTTIFIEWEEFPKGGCPEFYFLKYQLLNNFAQKVRHHFFLTLMNSKHSVNSLSLNVISEIGT